MLVTDADVPRFKELDVTVQTSAQWATPDPYAAMCVNIIGKDVVDTEWMRMNSVLKRAAGLRSEPTGLQPATFRRTVRWTLSR